MWDWRVPHKRHLHGLELKQLRLMQTRLNELITHKAECLHQKVKRKQEFHGKASSSQIDSHAAQEEKL